MSNASIWQALRSGQQQRVCVVPGGEETPPRYLFPGAFNPLHDGHLKIAAWVEQDRCERVDFEISLRNVDKPALSDLDLESRIAQFSGDHRLWLTVAPTFVEKSQLFPAVTFLVGVDTIARIADPKYYEGAETGIRAACQHFADRGIRFLVFGRQLHGRFVSLANLELPRELVRRCTAVPEEAFRVDISSSELRRKMRHEG